MTIEIQPVQHKNRVVVFTEPNGEGLDGLRAAGSQRDGISGQQEVCPSRPRCQELHVSSST